MRKAAATWSGEWYKMGGGATVWDGMAYDPQANLVYFGTGNGGPWPEVLRGSQGKDNLYVCSIIAVNPDNGEMKWYYQAVPGDSWDYDSVQQLTLADITIAGRAAPRHHAGEQERLLLRGRSHHRRVHLGVAVRAAELVRSDGQEDRPSVHSPARVLRHRARDDLSGPARRAQLVADVVQSADRARLRSGHAALVVHVHREPVGVRLQGRRTQHGNGPWRARRRIRHPNATPPTPFVPPMVGPTDGQRGGVLIAWDPATQTERWRKEGGGASGGGTVTTASNLLLQVVPDGRLIVYSADKGEKLHEINTGLRVGMGPPITYMVDGKQYVTILGGRGVVVPPPVAAGAAPTAPPDAGRGGGPATEPPPTTPPKILTFALDGNAK